MKLGVLKETKPGENRVAIAPASLAALTKAGIETQVESGAGIAAGFLDAEYRDKGASIVSRDDVFASNIVACVRAAGANKDGDASINNRLRSQQIIVATCDPLGEPAAIQSIASSGATLFSLEMIPRITRAQSMDVLSSQATIAGYRAVLMAAMNCKKMFPMMMTAAGTLTAAKVFVIGAGVAGLQAIATAKRLGSIVSAYDVRPAVREQVESVGGKFVELQLEAANSEDKGGYAKAMDDDFYRKQQAFMADIAAQHDVVICTAAIPGKKSPVLVTADAVRRMPTGAVVIDLAAERGGNCELTQADQTVHVDGVTIFGPTNIAAEVPHDASLMFSHNVTKFLTNLIKKGELNLNLEDEIIRECMMTRDGNVASSRVRGLLGLDAA
jgi:H+-translocating NAD(P) transhydrogenase subunit alpha